MVRIVRKLASGSLNGGTSTDSDCRRGVWKDEGTFMAGCCLLCVGITAAKGHRVSQRARYACFEPYFALPVGHSGELGFHRWRARK